MWQYYQGLQACAAAFDLGVRQGSCHMSSSLFCGTFLSV
jgi:hypothetical protein